MTAFTVELLSAFVAKNNVRSEDQPALIAATYQALSGLDATIPNPDEPVADEHVAAVTARRSLADRNVILSMIDVSCSAPDGEPTEPRAAAPGAVPAKRKYTRRAQNADTAS